MPRLLISNLRSQSAINAAVAEYDPASVDSQDRNILVATALLANCRDPRLLAVLGSPAPGGATTSLNWRNVTLPQAQEMIQQGRQTALLTQVTASSMSPAAKHRTRLVAGATMIGTGIGLFFTGVGASVSIPLILSGLFMMRTPKATGIMAKMGQSQAQSKPGWAGFLTSVGLPLAGVYLLGVWGLIPVGLAAAKWALGQKYGDASAAARTVELLNLGFSLFLGYHSMAAAIPALHYLPHFGVTTTVGRMTGTKAAILSTGQMGFYLIQALSKVQGLAGAFLGTSKEQRELQGVHAASAGLDRFRQSQELAREQSNKAVEAKIKEIDHALEAATGEAKNKLLAEREEQVEKLQRAPVTDNGITVQAARDVMADLAKNREMTADAAQALAIQTLAWGRSAEAAGNVGRAIRNMKTISDLVLKTEDQWSSRPLLDLSKLTDEQLAQAGRRIAAIRTAHLEDFATNDDIFGKDFNMQKFETNARIQQALKAIPAGQGQMTVEAVAGIAERHGVPFEEASSLAVSSRPEDAKVSEILKAVLGPTPSMDADAFARALAGLGSFLLIGRPFSISGK
jgi:hypothetical protein